MAVGPLPEPVRDTVAAAWCWPQSVLPGEPGRELLGARSGPGGGGVVGYECDGCELTFVDGLPTGPDGFEVVATAPATPFDERTTPFPLAPGGCHELEFHAERLGLAPEVLRHGHAVLGCRPGCGGVGTVVTVGCTDWAYGLGDPIVEQVSRNILARLR
jgi:hypothetical protein